MLGDRNGKLGCRLSYEAPSLSTVLPGSAAMAATLKSPSNLQNMLWKAEGNEHGRVPANLCQIYASHGCLTQHAPHWKSDRSIGPSHEVFDIKDFIAGAAAVSMDAAKAGA